jgi:hypothetical protein
MNLEKTTNLFAIGAMALCAGIAVRTTLAGNDSRAASASSSEAACRTASVCESEAGRFQALAVEGGDLFVLVDTRTGASELCDPDGHADGEAGRDCAEALAERVQNRRPAP